MLVTSIPQIHTLDQDTVAMFTHKVDGPLPGLSQLYMDNLNYQ